VFSFDANSPVSADDVVARRQERAAIDKALASLSARDRAFLVLHLDQGLGAQEIGALVGMNDGAVRVALHRATERVKRRIVDDSKNAKAPVTA
jgi:RNA polymerase sigma-70 factor (ECF subfamily)